MSNVRRHYLIVGLLEDYVKFLELAEILLPVFFRGAGKIYSLKEKALKEHSATGFREEMDEQTRRHISNTYAMKLEIKFYEFVRNRFDQQYDHYKVK